ncbi:MAG: putative nucleotide-binding protein containing TIR-like domain [Bacteroidetes bacterium]|jgi:predicted nucleotide-binding protein|nr:putative nucleotide-binding protein containing TIR-like domain [Bacteroidota bacterium]
MEFEPKLKPLYANLKRLKIGDYLATKEFELFVLENDLDELWKECEGEVSSHNRVYILGDTSTEDEEEAFMYLMSAWFDQYFYSFHKFILPVLLNFAKWNKTKLDYTGVIANLKKIGLEQANVLNFAKDFKKIRDSKPDKVEDVKIKLAQLPNIIINSKKIFVVHGHDDNSRHELCNILKDEFKLEPVVMQKEPNKSLDTIISKFERLASDCSAAIVLFTPDDIVGTKKRPRQNVIFELGYFLGKFQEEHDRKIIVLKKGDLEVLSDISGVIYLEYNKSVKEVFLDLKQQFAHWGYSMT